MERCRRRTYLQACDLLRIANEIADENELEVSDDDDDNQVADVIVDDTAEEDVTSENLAIDDEGDIEAYEEESSDCESDDSDANEAEETVIVCAGINYRRCPYFSTTRGGNILTETPRALCQPTSEI